MSAVRVNRAGQPRSRDPLTAAGREDMAQQLPAFAHAPIEKPINELRAGRPVVLVHNGSRALVAPALMATPSLVDSLERLAGKPISLAVPTGTLRRQASESRVCSISNPACRAYAVQRALHGGAAVGEDRGIELVEGARGGVLVRPGLAEGAIDLIRVAGLGVGALFTEVDDCRDCAAHFARLAIPEVSLAELSVSCAVRERPVERAIEVQLPTLHGNLDAVGYHVPEHGIEFIALLHGDVSGRLDVPVAVHQGCLLGDALAACPCGCGSGLERALDNLTKRSRGILIRLEAGPETFFHASRAPEPAAVGYAIQVLADVAPSSVVFVDTDGPLRRLLLAHCGPFAR